MQPMTAHPHRLPVARPLAAAAASALLLLGVGCSSSSDDESSPTTTSTTAETAPAGSSDELSEEEWRDQANAICAETAPAIMEAFEAMDPASPTPEQVDHVVTTLVEVNHDTQERIEALTPPEALADQVEALLAANADATAALEEQGPAALETLDQIFAPANELATDLGLDACAG